MRVQYSYFDSKGEQKRTEARAKTFDKLIEKMKQHEVYQVLMVSKELADTDWTSGVTHWPQHREPNINLSW